MVVSSMVVAGQWFDADAMPAFFMLDAFPETESHYLSIG
jgi:hypothetical protein